MASATDEARIIEIERAALDRWGAGDPQGFLDLYGPDVTYFDPATRARIDGHAAMAEYYRPWFGIIRIDRYEMLDPRVVMSGDLALLSYNLVNYAQNADGTESVGSCWNSTAVFQRQAGAWKTLHTHWSFTAHPALQSITPEDSERQANQA